PRGRSHAGVCTSGNALVLKGVRMGLLEVTKGDPKQKGIQFGGTDEPDEVIEIREEYGSNGVVRTEFTSPFVGPGLCSNDGLTACMQDTDTCTSSGNACCTVPAATCDGRRQLSDPANPYVDDSGTTDNFLRCQTAQAELINDQAAVALL